jgi:hypothetical protein
MNSVRVVEEQACCCLSSVLGGVGCLAGVDALSLLPLYYDMFVA